MKSQKQNLMKLIGTHMGAGRFVSTVERYQPVVSNTVWTNRFVDLVT